MSVFFLILSDTLPAIESVITEGWILKTQSLNLAQM